MKLLTGDDIFPTLLEVVKKAQRSVKIASAWIKGDMFAQLMDILKEKGIKPEVIIRASEFTDLNITDPSVFEKVKELGGTVYLCPRLHAKFLLADGERAVVASANFTFSGLSELTKGNIEAGVYYDKNDDPQEVEKLNQYFERIKTEFSEPLRDNLIGFVLNPVRTDGFEFITVRETPSLEGYVEVKLDEKKTLVGKIASLYAYDMGFFANPFVENESPVFAPLEDFKKLFDEDKNPDWKTAAAFAYVNGNGNRVTIAEVKPLGILDESGRLNPVDRPFPVGTPVYTASSETLSSLVRKKFGGLQMQRPVKVGLLWGTDVDFYVDAQEVLRKHMLIIGTTGSGKSYFAKRFVSRIFKTDAVDKIFVLDPHGEYYDDLVSLLGKSEDIEHVEFPDTLFPLTGDEVVELLKESGFADMVSGNSKEVKRNRSLLMKYFKPSLRLTHLKEKTLEEIIGKIDTEEGEVWQTFSDTYGEEVLTNQPQVWRLMNDSLNLEGKKIVVYDFRNISDATTRVNIAGLILQEIFNRKKRNPKGEEFLVVLEEAHNFAPEKGYGDVSASTGNLALVMSRKIAAEGRKFGIGLVTITQRPAQVSKYVLAQMNTQAMFRTVNSSDLSAISTYVEYTGGETVSLLPQLTVGQAVFSGLGVPFPAVVRIV